MGRAKQEALRRRRKPDVRKGWERVSGMDPRRLQLKIRVTARKGIIKAKEDLIDAIESTIATGVVPEGITIHWIDWRKGEGGEAGEGHITANIAKELEAFWLAVSHDDTETLLRHKAGKSARWKLRAERVSED